MSAVSSESPRAGVDLTEAEHHSGEGAAPDHPSDASPASKDFGPNEWLVDELYQRYLADPGSVDMAWWNFFADYSPPAGSTAARAAAQHGLPTAPAPAAPGPAAPAPANGSGTDVRPGGPVPQEGGPAIAAPAQGGTAGQAGAPAPAAPPKAAPARPASPPAP